MAGSLIGVDLGGTSIRALVHGIGGAEQGRAATFTKAHEGPQAVVGRIIETIVAAAGDLAWSEVRGIGIGAPGPLDPYEGIVIHAPNLPDWHHVPLRRMVQDHFGVPVVLGNDANLAALGEHAYGAGRGVSDMIYMTVSTGIGGGIISGGELFLGSHGYAGEIGHQTILVDGPLCGCGNHGCLEALAAGPAIGRMGQEAAAQGVAPYLLELGCGHPQQVTGRHVTQAAREGDGPAVEIIARAGRYIGMGLANLANILNPSLFVIGGGVSTVGNVLFDAVRASLSCSAMYATRDVTVVPAGLGEDVGLLGAVELISRALSRR